MVRQGALAKRGSHSPLIYAAAATASDCRRLPATAGDSLAPSIDILTTGLGPDQPDGSRYPLSRSCVISPVKGDAIDPLQEETEPASLSTRLGGGKGSLLATHTAE
jgi:hypothetical protein